MNNRRGAYFQQQRLIRQMNEQIPDYIDRGSSRNTPSSSGSDVPVQDMQQQHAMPRQPKKTTPKLPSLSRPRPPAKTLPSLPSVPKKIRSDDGTARTGTELTSTSKVVLPPGQIPDNDARSKPPGNTIVPMENGGTGEHWADVHGIKPDEILAYDKAVRRCRYKPSDSIINSILHVIDKYRGERDLSTRQLAENVYKMGVKSIWFTRDGPVMPVFLTEDQYLAKLRVTTCGEAFNTLPDDDNPSSGNRRFVVPKGT